MSVEGLSVVLGGRRVLDAVGLEAGPAGWLGVLGANGGGKTTLLRTLAGRLTPSAGRILLDGRDLAADPAARAALFGYAPPLAALPGGVTAGELVRLVARARRADPHRPAALFDALELARIRDRPVDALSSGWRQRLALGLAFVGEPRVVLLDEPFNWLDPVAAYDVKDRLTALAADRLVVTALHDVSTFALRCDHGLLLHDGRVSARFASPDLAAARTDLAGFERGVYETLRASSA